MSTTLIEQREGRLLKVQVSGKLTPADYGVFGPEVNRLVEQYGRIDILFEMRDFHGWNAAALWEDAKFAAKHFNDIARLAVVGQKRWQRGMTAFCRPFTRAEIRYFNSGQEAEARAWLKATP